MTLQSSETMHACAQVHISRAVIISEEGPVQCRHTITGSVVVKVPAVGRLVEKYVMENTVAAMRMLDTVVDRHVFSSPFRRRLCPGLGVGVPSHPSICPSCRRQQQLH